MSQAYLNTFFFLLSDSDMIGHCNGGKWTEWMNRDTPSGDGDYEISYIHRKKTKFCWRPIGLQVDI